MSNIIRFQFTKGSEVQYLSHLDLLRTMERALRRARLPVAYSGGFSPRPIMAFGFALPVGVLSEAEYGDFELTKKLDPKDFLTIYNKYLPRGFNVIAAENLPDGAPSLMREINVAQYNVFIPGTDAKEFDLRWSWLQDEDTFLIERQTKKKVRTIDVLPLLYDVLAIEASSDGAVIECICALGNDGNLRIEELGALLNFNPKEAVITRTAQLIKGNNHYEFPMRNRGSKWKES